VEERELSERERELSEIEEREKGGAPVDWSES
jgi:hypothetical protein